MHMADALLSPAVAATMYVASGAAASVSIKKLRQDNEPQKLPTMAVAAAVADSVETTNLIMRREGS